MGQLHDILHPGPEIPIRRSMAYVWEQLYGREAIQKEHAKRTLSGAVEVQIDDEDSRWNRGHGSNITAGWEVVAGYGASWVASEEAYEYSDGCIVLCAVISAFQDSFSSNSNETQFFLLTPLKEVK